MAYKVASRNSPRGGLQNNIFYIFLKLFLLLIYQKKYKKSKKIKINKF
jgi:hypothetical protein